jgi:hypothetical protein
MIFNSSGYLDAGIHAATLDDIEEFLVRAFPNSTTRPKIFEGYKRHREALKALGLKVEQFLNGSFASTKSDPGDIDLVCFVDARALDNLTVEQQQEFARLVSGPITKEEYLCDAYYAPMVHPEDPAFGECRSNRKYWAGEFGFDRSEQPKGIVRVLID